MLCKLQFTAENPIVLPFEYNTILQAMIYNLINEEDFAEFIHDTGYTIDRKKFKLFSFSSILQKPILIDKKEKRFTFPNEVSFYLSSIPNYLFESVFNSILNEKTNLQMGRNNVVLTNVQNIPQSFSNSEIVKTYSPITIYDTFTNPEGHKKTHYYNPRESEFSQKVRKNLISKYESLYERLPENDEFSIEFIGNPKEKVLKYKGFLIKGYWGTLKIEGSKELMTMAFCAGLGMKNSQGLGLIIQKDMEV